MSTPAMNVRTFQVFWLTTISRYAFPPPRIGAVASSNGRCDGSQLREQLPVHTGFPWPNARRM